MREEGCFQTKYKPESLFSEARLWKSKDFLTGVKSPQMGNIYETLKKKKKVPVSYKMSQRPV